MKKSIKLLTVVLMLSMVIALFAGCHPKNEIAITVGDYNFTSAYYSCVLIMADSEARSIVANNLSEANEDTSNIDFSKQEIDGVKFNDYVKNKAIEIIKMNAAVKTLCAEKGIEIDNETKSYAEYYAEYNWTNYGYSTILEKYGISKNTYLEYITDSYFGDIYFNHLYEEGGEKALTDDEIKKILEDNYVLLDSVSQSLTTTDSTGTSVEISEDEASALEEEFNSYAKQLNEGTITWDEVYNMFNPSTETGTETEVDAATVTGENTSSESTSSESAGEDSDELQSLTPNATVYSSNDQDTTIYYAAKDYGMGVATVYKDTSNIYIFVKRDMCADPYYLKEYRIDATYLQEKDNFENNIKSFGETLSFHENTFATGQFKVSKISYETED